MKNIAAVLPTLASLILSALLTLSCTGNQADVDRLVEN